MQAIEERVDFLIPTLDDQTVAEEVAKIFSKNNEAVEDVRASPDTNSTHNWTIADIGIPCHPIYSDANFSITQLGLPTNTINQVYFKLEQFTAIEAQSIPEVNYEGVPTLFSEVLVEENPTTKVVLAEETTKVTQQLEPKVKLQVEIQVVSQIEAQVPRPDTSSIGSTTLSSEYDSLFSSFYNDEELTAALLFTVATPFTKYGLGF